jgi:V8-like Glu-specific endopeptidase
MRDELVSRSQLQARGLAMRPSRFVCPSTLSSLLLLGACTPPSGGWPVQSTDEAIQNGTPAAPPGSRTGIEAAIVRLNGCTGTLVRKNWVLSAAHCVAGGDSNGEPTGEVFSDDAVSLDGTTFQNKTVTAANIYVFRDIGAVDAALLKLPESVSPDVSSPSIFGGQDSDVIGHTVTTYGYGGTNDLRKGVFTVSRLTANGEMINSAFDGKYLVVPGTGVGDAMVTTVPGDSGGPTMLGNQLVGLTGGGNWRTYAKLFREWVDTTVGNDDAGVLHPNYPLSFYFQDNRKATRIADWASGKWKSECGDQYTAGGLSYDQNATVGNPPVSLPGSRGTLCRFNGRLSTGASTPVDFSAGDNRRDTSGGNWDASGFKGECASNEAITGLAQTPVNGSTGKALGVALCSPMANQPNASRACVNLPIDGTTLGTLNDGWAYNGIDNYGFFKAECPMNYFMKGVSRDSNGKPRVARCCYDFVPTGASFFLANLNTEGTPRKADLIAARGDMVEVQTSTGSVFNYASKWIDGQYTGAQSITDAASGRTSSIYFADVTGDGKADAIVANSFGITVRRSDGTRFLPNDPNWIDGAFTGTHGLFFADVTGDGKADAIVSNDSGITVRRSDGTKFLPNETWTTIAFTGTNGLFFADVTGDGKADAIVSNDFGVTVRRSDGTKFLPNDPNWINGAFTGQYGTFLADVTGDGKADAIVINDFGITVRRSTGTSFAANENWGIGM